MKGIFISYRRQDAAPSAGRLRDALAHRYGDRSVFLDIDSIAPGVDFTRALREEVAGATVMLVVMGPSWASATDREGRRRLDDPTDFIRVEVAAALRLNKVVIPVLVGGARMPPDDDLPADLRELSRRNAVDLDDDSYADGISRLFNALDRVPGLEPAAIEARARSGRNRGDSFITRLRVAGEILFGARGVNAGGWPGPEGGRPDAQERPPWLQHPPNVNIGDEHQSVGRVFVSYSHDDRALIDRIVEGLEALGHPCWIAHRDIPGGTPSWAGAIVQAIATSHVAVVMLTKHSVGSTQVLREVTVADDEKVPLVAFRLDEAPLSKELRYYFATAQHLEVAGLRIEEAVRRLGESVAGRAYAQRFHPPAER